ncbi:MAG: YfhO family protein, partial [Planctomycetota bacterium]
LPARLCFDWACNVSRDLEVVANPDPFTLYRYKAGRGRFWTVRETRRATDPETAFTSAVAADHDPRLVAIVEDAPELHAAPGTADSIDAPPAILEESSRRVVLRVNAARDAWLVATLSWYPGWKAWVDGAPVALTRTNYAFLGLSIASGEHEVVLEFDSASVRLGAWISIAGLCATLALLAASRTGRYKGIEAAVPAR